MALSVVVLAPLKVCALAGLWLPISIRKPMTARGKQKPFPHDRHVHTDCPKRNRNAGHTLTTRFRIVLVNIGSSREAAALLALMCSRHIPAGRCCRAVDSFSDGEPKLLALDGVLPAERLQSIQQCMQDAGTVLDSCVYVGHSPKPGQPVVDRVL